MAMESRLFAVHDPTGENVRLEAASDSVQSPAVLLGASRPPVFGQEEPLLPSEMPLAQADATGQVRVVSAPVRPAGEPDHACPEPVLQGVVQPSERGETVAGKSDRNWFLNTRIRAVLPRIRGRLLDVGCGTNELVRRYGNGLGVQRVSEIPDTEKFDTITLVAVLNYVPEQEREEVLKQCYARMNQYGRLIVTCRTPATDWVYRMLRPDDCKGLPQRILVGLIERCSFRLVYDRPFMFGLNRVYVFGKEEVK